MRGLLRRAALTAALCAAVAALAAPSAVAVPEVGDAGELLPTAQEPGPPGALASIEGTIASTSDRDIYKVCLNAPAQFSATTIGLAGFDTQLFLLDSQGRGVYANDDASLTQSLLPVAGAPGNAWSPTTPGVYHLAISPYNWDPVSGAERLFRDITALTGPLNQLALTGWAGSNLVFGGSYRINLTGTRSCIVPDTTPPTIDLRTPPENAVYDRGQSVLADYGCDDGPDGSGVVSCSGDVPDGEPLDTATLGAKTFTVTTADEEGNSDSVTHRYRVVDGTDPTIDLRTPPQGAVYARGEQVRADYDCADEQGGSGLASCSGDVADGAFVDTATLGAKSFTVSAVDSQGNSFSVTHSYRVEDRTEPSIELGTPGKDAVYERGSVVEVDYSCRDDAGGSGIASCSGDLPDGADLDTSKLGAATFTVTATDNAGNGASVTHGYKVVDGAAPAIDLRSPQDGATYALDQRLLADYSCSDEPGGAGLVSCDGDRPVGSPVDTSEPGQHTFTVRARDGAGNAATRTATYSVGFDFEGFYWPVLNRPRVNLWKAGGTVPIAFSLDGYQGRDVIADGYPRSQEIRCGSTVDVAGAQPTRSAGRKRLRYKPRRDLYVYLWRTDRRWAGRCRQFVLELVDGSQHRADFRFFGRHRPGHDHDDDDD